MSPIPHDEMISRHFSRSISPRNNEGLSRHQPSQSPQPTRRWCHDYLMLLLAQKVLRAVRAVRHAAASHLALVPRRAPGHFAITHFASEEPPGRSGYAGGCLLGRLRRDRHSDVKSRQRSRLVGLRRALRSMISRREAAQQPQLIATIRRDAEAGL